MKKILAVLFVLFLAWAPVPAATAATAAPARIGIIDTQKILREAKAAKEARDAFLQERRAKQAAYAGQEKEVLRLQEELNKLDEKTPAAGRRSKAEKLGHEVKELKRFKDDLEEELKRKERELTTKILQDVRRLLVDFRKREGLTAIFEKSAVVVYDDQADVTDRIIKIYDAYSGAKK